MTCREVKLHDGVSAIANIPDASLEKVPSHSRISRRVDELIDDGLSMGDAIAQAVTEAHTK
jgi:hypothetical protein